MKINSGSSPESLYWSLGGFKVTFNPESYRERHTNRYSKSLSINSPGGPTRYEFSEPSVISLTLTLDATGTNNFGIVEAMTPGFLKTDIAKQIETFKKKTTYVSGSNHEPPWLRLIWGDLDFIGKLTSLSIHYKLFSSSGKPLRANLDISVMGGHTDKGWKRKLNKQSPDVTHHIMVNDGDTLPMLCKQVYGHERYFIQVARANQLNDFRNLTPGMMLHFPPLIGEEAEA